MFDRRYRINSTKRSLKFTEKCGTTFCYRLTVSAWVHLFIISVCLVREHEAIQNGRHRLFRPRYFRKASILRQDGRCTSVLVRMIRKFINEKEIGLPLFSIISMQNKPYPFPCILQILTAESLLKDFLIHLFYSHFGIITYFNNI